MGSATMGGQERFRLRPKSSSDTKAPGKLTEAAVKIPGS